MTLTYGTAPSIKGHLHSVNWSLHLGLLVFPSLRSCTTTDHPTHILHSTQGNCPCSPHQGGQVPVSMTPVITNHKFTPMAKAVPALFTVIPMSSVLHHIAVLLPLAHPNTSTAPMGINPEGLSLSMPLLHTPIQQPILVLLSYFILFICSTAKMKTCGHQPNVTTEHFWETNYGTTDLSESHCGFLNSTN